MIKQQLIIVCGVEPILPEEKVKKMLQRIYYYNFELYNTKLAESKQGLGAVNGIKVLKSKIVDNKDKDFVKFDAKVVEGSFQARESWTGVCYNLAALFILYGEKDKAFEIIKSVYQGSYFFFKFIIVNYCY